MTKKREQYETIYKQYKFTSGDSANASPSELKADLANEGQITRVLLRGTENFELTISVDEAGTGSDVHDITFAGGKEYNYGSFDEPVLEFGHNMTIQADNVTNPSSVTGVQLVIDERNG